VNLYYLPAAEPNECPTALSERVMTDREYEARVARQIAQYAT
jgi:hypothetical protein